MDFFSILNTVIRPISYLQTHSIIGKDKNLNNMPIQEVNFTLGIEPKVKYDTSNCLLNLLSLEHMIIIQRFRYFIGCCNLSIIHNAQLCTGIL